MEQQSRTNTIHKHPRETANILSLMFFCWTFPTFAKGYRKELDEDDLYGPMKNHRSSLLGDKLERAWIKEQGRTKPSLYRALFRVFGLQLFWQGLVLVLIESLKMMLPFCIGKLIAHFSPGKETVTKREAYCFASAIIIIAFTNTLLGHSYMLNLQHLGMKIRVACCSLIYRKALKLSKTALAETTIGQMVNLLSNDVNRFDYVVMQIHYLWLAPIQAVVVMVLLYYMVGPTGIAGVAFLLAFIPFQMYLGEMSSVYRLRTALRTDERVRLMSEIISGIQVIKMYTWEKPFASLVEVARKMEIKQIRAISYIRATLLSFMIITARIAIFITCVTHVLTGNMLIAVYVFVVTSFYNVLRQSMVQFFPQSISQLAEANVTVRRLSTFLLYEQVKTAGDHQYQKRSKGLDDGDARVVFVDATAKWSKSIPENTLSNISLTFDDSQLVAIIGEVGSGKSSLLNVILNELPLLEGRIKVNGRLSYASQEPWLFTGTVKQNILFGQPMNAQRYHQVVNVCSLGRDMSLFSFGDRSMIGERGVTLSGGQRARISLARALYKEADIYLLDDPLSAVDAQVAKELYENAISKFLREKCVVLVTHQLHLLQNADKIVLMEKGKITAVGTYHELQESGRDFTKMLDDQPDREKTIGDGKSKKEEDQDDWGDDENDFQAEKRESMSTGRISGKIYKAYARAGGKCCSSVMILIAFLLAQISASGCDYFVSFWVNLEEKKNQHHEQVTNIEQNVFSTYHCIYIYAAIVVALVVFTISRSISFFSFCMRASTNLHNNMFDKIVYGKMKFFNANPSGRILNRFSKDMGAIDDYLPGIIMDTLQIGLNVLGISIVIATVNHWILIPSCFILVIFYILRMVYVKTSRNLKRLEGTTRSPVFTHLSSSLQGLTTIRAFGAQEALTIEFDNHQDLHSSAFYLFLGCTRTFGFWIDLHCGVYIALVTFSFLLIDMETGRYGGNVGLAITQAIGLTGMLQWGMRQWSELENQMTAVERVVEYTEIEHEVDRAKTHPPPSWPENGTIEFRNVSLSYTEEHLDSLKDINIKVNANEKVGIVGRTGAGKSSLIMALFRIADIEGCILIDEQITSEVPLQILRSKLSIIPQEPVLFSGSVRKNLDPFDEFEDDQIWDSLNQVELKHIVSELPGGIEGKMSEGGSNFSVGQRQLFCLARAILRRNKILVLDEATANVDPKTDSFIQSTIRKKFVDCTVLTIAHRLNTVVDSDRVLVMDYGRVAEFDHPYVLLMKKSGTFYELVQQTGTRMAGSLLTVAKANYNKKKT